MQVHEQCRIWQNNGKLEKQNQCKTFQQHKRLFKMDIKAKIYVAKNIR